MVRRNTLAIIGSLLAVALLATVAVGSRWQTADAQSNCSTATSGISGTEQELLNLINAHRQQNGAGALNASPNLSRAAAWMSEDLNSSGVFSHTDSLGRSAFARVIQCGYSGNGAGENIASTGSAASAFDLFLNSPGHNTNMLNPAWTVVGVGQTGRMWVVDFGTVDDSNQPWDSGAPPTPPSPTPSPTATRPPSGAQPTSTPSAVSPPPNSGGGAQGASSSDPSVPGAVRTVLPAPVTPQYKLPSNVPVKRAMVQMVATE